MLLSKEISYSRRPSAADILVKSSRPMLRKPWQAAIAIACLWLVYATVDQFRDSLSPSLVGDIKTLHAAAISDFETMISRQSTTLLDARAEYERRYDLQPPPLYDEWYDFAVKSGSHLIDEFDNLMEVSTLSFTIKLLISLITALGSPPIPSFLRGELRSNSQ